MPVDFSDDAIGAYDFVLPPSLVAQRPTSRRDLSRLLVWDRTRSSKRHRSFSELGEELGRGDLLIINDSKVLPARLHGFRPGGGKVELLLLRPSPSSTQGEGDGERWRCLLRPGARVKAGMRLRFGEDEGWEAEVLPDPLPGDREVRFRGPGTLAQFLERWGSLPLPPYIEREQGPDADDRERYQTVYAKVPGAVAAPTAGLHFTPELMESLDVRGVEVASLTLHVGLGTFEPVRSTRLSHHPLHSESYRIPPETALRLKSARREGRRIIAVGTTSCRAVESWNEEGCPGDGSWRETRLLLWPGHPPQVTTGLLTNFHLPRTTLLALVAAFTGREALLATYGEAIARGYRFYSYGDALLVL